MKVLFYGRLAEALGAALDVGVDAGSSVAQLRDRLAADHPDAGDVLRSRRTRACVGDTLVPDDYRIVATDTLEFLPPLSGG